MLPHFAGKLAPLVLPVTTVILGGTACLIFGALLRRRQREKYFASLDEARSRYKPIVMELLAGRREYEGGLAALKGIGGPQRIEILERLCFEKLPEAAEVPVLSRLCHDLGLVEEWQHNLTGGSGRAAGGTSLRTVAGRVGRLSFLVRARSAENLRLIRDQPSWPLLVKALDDPEPDVQAVAARALAAIAEPQSFPALVEKLHRVVSGPGIGLSVRSIKAALVVFPIQFASGLLVSLKHPHPCALFHRGAAYLTEKTGPKHDSFGREFRGPWPEAAGACGSG